MIVTLILQVRKQRDGRFNQLAQGHIASVIVVYWDTTTHPKI